MATDQGTFVNVLNQLNFFFKLTNCFHLGSYAKGVKNVCKGFKLFVH